MGLGQSQERSRNLPIAPGGETEAEVEEKGNSKRLNPGLCRSAASWCLSSLPAPTGELCDEVVDHCVPGLNLCQHEAKCVSLDKGFR